MTDEVRNPYDLFLELQPKFREIELVPQGFSRYYTNITPRFCFYPKFAADQTEPYTHPSMYRGSRDGHDWCYDNGNFLKFDVAEAKLPFEFRYDPALERGIDAQLDAVAGATILAGPLKRRFSISVGNLDALEKDLTGQVSNGIPITLKWEPAGHIEGMKIPKTLFAVSWRFFFPDKSPERNAISFAIEYARTRRDLDRFPTEAKEAERLHQSAVSNYQAAMKVLAQQASPA